METCLSTSPKSVMMATRPANLLVVDDDDEGLKSTNMEQSRRFSVKLSLEEFISVLPETLEQCQESKRGSENDPVSNLFSRLKLSKEEWHRYALFDPNKNYTRNLIATDGKTFTLLFLCWNPGKMSPIHDHPCDGCWMRVFQGDLQECRFVKDETNDCLTCFSDETFGGESFFLQEFLDQKVRLLSTDGHYFCCSLVAENKIAYISDFMGYHKVGNPSSNRRTISMHLYSPPFQRCKIWLDPQKASSPTQVTMCNYSEYGLQTKQV